ncbi:MyTH4 domain-containing protein, partial [Ochromonadaceae sp. CCMP2298]
VTGISIYLDEFRVSSAAYSQFEISKFKQLRVSSVYRVVDIPSLVLDLVGAADRLPYIRNELYFQLCKQLTDNPNPRSWLRGWLLMSIYLHYFTPTHDALQYVRNFVESQESLLGESMHK